MPPGYIVRTSSPLLKRAAIQALFRLQQNCSELMVTAPISPHCCSVFVHWGKNKKSGNPCVRSTWRHLKRPVSAVTTAPWPSFGMNFQSAERIHCFTPISCRCCRQNTLMCTSTPCFHFFTTAAIPQKKPSAQPYPALILNLPFQLYSNS